MPEGLSPEQKKIFRESLTFIRHPGTGYQTAIAELLAKHPDLAKKMEVIRRDQVIDRVAAVFSKTSIEVAVLLDRAKLRLTKEELQKALDVGRVMEVMEESKAMTECEDEPSETEDEVPEESPFRLFE